MIMIMSTCTALMQTSWGTSVDVASSAMGRLVRLLDIVPLADLPDLVPLADLPDLVPLWDFPDVVPGVLRLTVLPLTPMPLTLFCASMVACCWLDPRAC